MQPPSSWLRLALVVALVPASATASPAPDEAATTTRAGRSLRIGGVVSMGLGAALLIPMALGTTEYYRATSTLERLNEFATAEDRRFTPEEFSSVEDTYQHSQRMKAVAITTGVLGAALVVSGLTLFVLGTRTPRYALSPSRGVSVVPTLTPRHAGISISARF